MNLPQLEKDFLKRPRWLRTAAARLVSVGALTPNDISQLAALCRHEVGLKEEGEIPAFTELPAGSLALNDTAISLRLDAIEAVVGVNALAPKSPLQFGDAPLCIIYGGNGSGKSGYARLLKHACGSRGATPPLANVYLEKPAAQTCTIHYTANGAKKNSPWSAATGRVAELAGVSVFDSACADLYVTKENEVTYEPALMRFFRQLVEACEQVSQRLSAEIATKPSVLPAMPPEAAGTAAGKWYSSLSPATGTAEIDTWCGWTAADEEEFAKLTVRIVESTPADKAKSLRKKRYGALMLANLMRSANASFADTAHDQLVAARKDAALRRLAATTDAKKVFENSLDGVASESWKHLWSAARKFSEEKAYPKLLFPYVDAGARCVLCQSVLDAEAAKRLVGFEGFIKGSLEASAAAAEAAVQETIKRLPTPASPSDVAAHLDLAGAEDASLRASVEVFYERLRARAKEYPCAASAQELPAAPDEDAADKLVALAASLEAAAAEFDKDATAEQKDKLKASAKEMGARKWAAQQRSALEAEVKRLALVAALKAAQSLTSTTWLSSTKSALAEKIVTEALIERFKAELKVLGASYLTVSIEKTKALKGQVFHQVKIAGAKQPAKTSEVLSEGQFRIVSIAAFIADMESRATNSTFIFDDPVSSLDQDFEEATANRLVELSKNRQVVVLTHRLSMLSLLEYAAAAGGIETCVVMLREAGEPDKTGRAQERRPDSALKVLLKERLSRAKKALKEQGQADYEIHAKAICSDLRITLERMVEVTLLSEVVSRFRRSISSMKFKYLAKITPADCKMVDEYMTKYSFHEHPQPFESPWKCPRPEELETDLQALIDWCAAFEKRPAPA